MCTRTLVVLLIYIFSENYCDTIKGNAICIKNADDIQPIAYTDNNSGRHKASTDKDNRKYKEKSPTNSNLTRTNRNVNKKEIIQKNT